MNPLWCHSIAMMMLLLGRWHPLGCWSKALLGAGSSRSKICCFSGALSFLEVWKTLFKWDLSQRSCHRVTFSHPQSPLVFYAVNVAITSVWRKKMCDFRTGWNHGDFHTFTLHHGSFRSKLRPPLWWDLGPAVCFAPKFTGLNSQQLARDFFGWSEPNGLGVFWPLVVWKLKQIFKVSHTKCLQR